MQINLPLSPFKPVIGEASIDIHKPIDAVFRCVGVNFFDNYRKWAPEVVELEPLADEKVGVGFRARQIRVDGGTTDESIFEITDYCPHEKIVIQGITSPYKQSYLLNCSPQKNVTLLTFRFELLELEIFMRPFAKLIRSAIEDGAESTVMNIKNLIMAGRFS